MNQELLEQHLCNQGSHYEKFGWFPITQRKPSRATTKLMLSTVSKDEWNKKEGTGKPLKNALDVPKGTSRAEAMSNSENQADSYAGMKASGSSLVSQ